MSHENVELARRVTDAFNRRDLDGLLALMDPDIEFAPFEIALAGGEPFRGHDGVRTWLEEAFAIFPDIRAELGDIHDLGAAVVASGRLHGQGSESGASFDRPLHMAEEWRDGKVVWWYAYATEAEALDAARLRA
jgi:ketosteroid isomerase-like protein